MNKEQERLLDPAWKLWGPYVSDRQWGTVREDYSANGDAWRFTTHDMARSKAWRWGEEAIGGICDSEQLLCFGLALWNEKDPLLKERFFGLTNPEGNHGEDVKELYYYLDSTPTHSYMKMLYKYPQGAFPYQLLIDENGKRNRDQPEFEIFDTGIFNEDRYFDVFIEYAKADAADILIKITAWNRGPAAAPIHLLPTIWFRNTWSWGYDNYQPRLFASNNCDISIEHRQLGNLTLYQQGDGNRVFCENESNNRKLYGSSNNSNWCKDGINNWLLHKQEDAINPQQFGTRAALHFTRDVPAGQSTTIELRLKAEGMSQPFSDFDKIFTERWKEAGEFYGSIQKNIDSEEAKELQRQAFAGMLWNKQFYFYNVLQWLDGDPSQPPPPELRKKERNHNWTHVNAANIISMPDKWEYPWFAGWDLAFHCLCFSLIDAGFAKKQLQLLDKEWYMHPNGQLPAYEWNFSDVNPPVHAWAAWRVYSIDKRNNDGKGDIAFLEAIFHKLLLNFTWWVNQKDSGGNNIFEGGFLGLDNIGAFDRSTPLGAGGEIEQSDGTGWMAMYSLNMLRISLELSCNNPVYQDMSTKFFEHFLYIAAAMEGVFKSKGLWDEEDQFYYDLLSNAQTGESVRLKLRSMVGLIPLFAVEVLDHEIMEAVPKFAEKLNWFLAYKPELANLVSRWQEKGENEKHLLSLMRGHRIKKLLQRMLDENEFLSPYGIRSISKYHEDHHFEITLDGKTFQVKYTPGESDTALFGGNSNWRGPIWMPVNFLIIESLQRFHYYYGDEFKVECPTGSGQYITLDQAADEVTRRLTAIFLTDKNGNRPFRGENEKAQKDPQFKNYILFHEYFHGDSGKGLGASHQTGWTGLIAKLLQPKRPETPDKIPTAATPGGGPKQTA